MRLEQLGKELGESSGGSGSPSLEVQHSGSLYTRGRHEKEVEGGKIKQLQIIAGTLAFPGVGAELCRYTMPVPVLGFAPGAGDGVRGIPLPAAEGGCSPPPSEPYERVVVLPETVAALCVVLDVFRPVLDEQVVHTLLPRRVRVHEAC